MRSLGETSIKALIRPKPSTIELVYIQANENEHSRTLTGQEREHYIQDLLEKGERQADISRNLCLEKSWVSKLAAACEFRQRFGEKFNAAGIDLDSRSAYRMSGAAEEAIEEAIEAIQAAPERKEAIVAALAAGTGKKGKPRSWKSREERVFEWPGVGTGMGVAAVAGEEKFPGETFLAADTGAEKTAKAAASPGKVREVMTVNRKTGTITLEYDCVDVVEGLSEVLRAAAAGWFGGNGK
jgi:hypothetical protein